VDLTGNGIGEALGRRLQERFGDHCRF
jgi:hypothetical protein